MIGSQWRSHESDAFSYRGAKVPPNLISLPFSPLLSASPSVSPAFPARSFQDELGHFFSLKRDVSQTSALSSRAERTNEWKWSGSESVHKQRPIWRCTQTRLFDLTAVSATFWRPIPSCRDVQAGHACFHMTHGYKACTFFQRTWPCYVWCVFVQFFKNV